MKTLKYITFLILSITFFSCSSEDNSSNQNSVDETIGLVKIQEISNDTHTIELYSKNGSLIQGYNHITLRVKNKKDGTYFKNAKIEWLPIMHMKMMEHSCPKSQINKAADKQTLYTGDIIFQMAENETEYWDLAFTYILDNVSYTAKDIIKVPASAKKTVSSFTGTDKVRYVIAYIAPENPKVALNDMSVAVYKMQDMMNFAVVNNYHIKIDPRMPSMGNHGSPNNTDLQQSEIGAFYKGKLSLTMTGYWKINLQVLNASNEILKGETITTDNPQSSLFFEIEF